MGERTFQRAEVITLFYRGSEPSCKLRISSGQRDDINKLSYFLYKIIPHTVSIVNPLLSHHSLKEEIYQATSPLIL